MTAVSSKTPKIQKNLMMFLFDDCYHDLFYQLADQGRCPHILKYILGNKQTDGTYANATICKNMITGFPSSSTNSHISLLSGTYARKNNILAAEFWDMTSSRPIPRNLVHTSMKNLRLWNTIMNPACKLLFEHVPNSAAFHAVSRGARVKFVNPRNILRYLPEYIRMKKHKLHSISADPEFWKFLARNNIPQYLAHAQSGELPQASFIVFLLSDEMAHYEGFNSDYYAKSLEILDYFVQLTVEGYTDPKGNHVKGIQELGLFEQMLWCICTDHGSRPVIPDNHYVINQISSMELGWSTVEPWESPINQPWKGKYSNIDAFTAVSGGFISYWYGGPTATQLKEYYTFYPESFFLHYEVPETRERQNFHPRKVQNIIEYFLQKPAVEFVLIPTETENAAKKEKLLENPINSPIPREYTITIRSRKGTGRIERTLQKEEIQYKYSIVNGEDPLQYASKVDHQSNTHSHQWWLAQTMQLRYPDVFHRLFGFFDCIHAPNLVITSALDYQFMPIDKWDNYFPKVQNHDGLNAIESVVPLTLAGPGVKKGIELKVGRNIDVLPTLLKLLGIEYKTTELDGEILSEAIE